MPEMIKFCWCKPKDDNWNMYFYNVATESYLHPDGKWYELSYEIFKLRISTGEYVRPRD